MSTSTVSVGPYLPPGLVEVTRHCDAAILSASSATWKGAPIDLGEHVPSVTSHVRRLQVEEREVFAKYSVLGVSLVSLLRGLHGPWADVLEAQDTYLRTPRHLVRREALQLGYLAGLPYRPLALRPIAVHHGVLFTEPAGGPTLVELLAAEPAAAGDLLSRAYSEVARLHPRGGGISSRMLSPERSIDGTFSRKFGGAAGPAYLERVTDRCAPADRVGIRRAVARLTFVRRQLRATGPDVLVFGDLKPEHVHWPEGVDGRPVFIDPGLHVAPATADVAKLVSRSFLSVLGRLHALPVLAGIRGFVEEFPGRQTEIAALWLMDTVNVLSTHLTAPAGMPLSRQGEDALAVVGVLAPSLHQAANGDMAGLWPRLLEHAEEAALAALGYAPEAVAS